MPEYKCDKCGELKERFKDLKKVNGLRFCKKCYVENRKQRRKETFEKSPDKEKIIELRNEENRRYAKERYKRLRGGDVRTYGVEKLSPIIKGSKFGKSRQENKSNSYLSFYEKQNLLRILMSNGLELEEAKERIRNLVQEQKRVREFMKAENKSEEDIRIKQQEMIEELWK